MDDKQNKKAMDGFNGFLSIEKTTTTIKKLSVHPPKPREKKSSRHCYVCGKDGHIDRECAICRHCGSQKTSTMHMNSCHEVCHRCKIAYNNGEYHRCKVVFFGIEYYCSDCSPHEVVYDDFKNLHCSHYPFCGDCGFYHKVDFIH